MFHRVPRFSATAVVLAVFILLVGMLFALSLSPFGTAYASHSGLPEVSILSVTPEIGEENRNLRVTLELSRALTEDEHFCYRGLGPNENPRPEVCIEGGIYVWDNYDDHRNKDEFNPTDQLVKFVFRGGQTEDRLTVSVEDDSCITPDRTIRIMINTAFDNSNTYGYTIDETVHTVPVHGDDDENGTLVENGGECLPVDEGATEEIIANRAPSFSGRDKTFSVREDTEAREEIGSPVTATDPDEDDTLEYSLTGTDAASFDIDPSTGQILTDGALDYETKQTYHLAVSVSDGMNIYGDSDMTEDDSIDVTINVTNVNEAPEFDANAPTDLNVMENTPAGENIGDPITATDPENGTLTYSLDDDDGAAFEIDANGQIQTKEPLDHETKGSYSLTVTASDDNGGESTHQVTITVTEANDPPAFTDENDQSLTSTTRSVAENTEAGQPVGAPVAATDEESDTLTYSLDTTGATNFDIDSSTGQIKVKEALDYESGTTSYSVTVSVHDGEDIGGNAEDPPVEDATIEVTINVTDVNEAPTFADDAPTELSVDENTATDTDITDGLYTATDPEDDTPLTYSLAGTDAASFAIDDATGQVKTNADLDHETNGSYSVTVTVSDSRDDVGAAEIPPVADTTIDVTITVTDVDEEGTITFSSDNPAAGTTLTATLDDDDTPISDETFQWAISNDGNTWTDITDATSASYTPETGDVDDYLRVTATYTDGHGPNKTAEATTSNTVDDAPHTNSQPAFAEETDTRSIIENTAAG